MFTPKVGHGHAVAACGNACGERGAGQRAERAAREDRRDRLAVRAGQHGPGPAGRRGRRRAGQGAAANAPWLGAAELDADGSGKNDSSVTRGSEQEAIGRHRLAVRAAVREADASSPGHHLVLPDLTGTAPARVRAARLPGWRAGQMRYIVLMSQGGVRCEASRSCSSAATAGRPMTGPAARPARRGRGLVPAGRRGAPGGRVVRDHPGRRRGRGRRARRAARGRIPRPVSAPDLR